MTSSYEADWRKDLEENQKRVKLQDIWYVEDGSHEPNHPKHGLYTGLAQLAREGKLAGVLADTNQSVDPLNNEK